MIKKSKLVLSLFTISLACTLNGVAFAQAENANIKQVSQVTGGKSEQPSGTASGTTKDQAEEGGLMKGSGTTCEVNYSINNGSLSTGFIDYGKVYFPRKREDCKAKAIANSRSEQKIRNLIPSFAPVGSQKMKDLCDGGAINVYYDTKLGNQKFTKDGYINNFVACDRLPCPPWTGYK